MIPREGSIVPILQPKAYTMAVGCQSINCMIYTPAFIFEYPTAITIDAGV